MPSDTDYPSFNTVACSSFILIVSLLGILLSKRIFLTPSLTGNTKADDQVIDMINQGNYQDLSKMYGIPHQLGGRKYYSKPRFRRWKFRHGRLLASKPSCWLRRTIFPHHTHVSYNRGLLNCSHAWELPIILICIRNESSKPH